MVSKSRYKSYGTQQRFKNRGDSLRASIGEIARQRQTEIDALKFIKQQEEKKSQLQIQNEERRGRTQTEVARINQNLENKIYQTKRNAIEVRATREVESIRGEAEEWGKEAAFWEDFAVNQSAKYGQLAQGLVDYANYRQGQEKLKDEDYNWAEKAAKELQKVVKDIELDTLTATYKKDSNGNYIDPITQKAMLVKGGSSNTHYGEQKVQEIQGQQSYFDALLARTAKTADGRTLLTPSLAQTTYIRFGYNVLRQLDINSNSKHGREIIQIFSNWGRELGETRSSQYAFAQDSVDIDNKAKVWVEEAKLFQKAIAGPDKVQKLKDLQITHQSFHKIITGSHHDLGNNKYGLRTDWNPQTLNRAIVDSTYPYLKDLPFNELFDLYNSLLIFDPNKGNLVKEKGEYIGVLTKSSELRTHLADLVKKNEEARVAALNAQQSSDRAVLSKPFEDLWSAIENAGSKEELEAAKQAWSESKDKAHQTYTAQLFKNTPYEDVWLKRIGSDPAQFGEYYNYNMFKTAYDAGDYEEAFLILANVPKEGYARDPRFEHTRKAVQVLRALDERGESIDAGAKSIYALAMGQTLFKDTSTLTSDDKRIVNAIENHIRREIFRDNSNDDAVTIFNNAVEKVAAEFKEGAEGKGLYARRDAAEANWTPAKYDSKGKVIEAGGYGDITGDSKRPEDVKGWVFEAFDDRIAASKTLSLSTIDELFFPAPVSFGEFRRGADFYSEHADLQSKISKNLNGPNSIISVDEKNFIARNVLSGTADNNALSTNLKLLIVRAKNYDPNITTKEVMDMVVNGLSENPAAGYSQLKGKSYPMGLEDITKKLTGRCSTSAKNNFAMCVNELVKLNTGLSISDIQSRGVGSGNILELLKEL